MESIDFESLYRNESRKVFATLVRLLGDFDLAEEATQEAFAAAIHQWAARGVPANPVSWLVSTGRFKAVDTMRRRASFKGLEPQLARRFAEIESSNQAMSELEIEDDQLRLIFTCCHPAIDPKVQVPLTLREVCGLTTEEIARAFLMSPSTMAQRIVRGKAKIRDARIPYTIPSLTDLPARLDPVLSVIYLVFNEGYSASSGESVTRVDLSDEAIRLARLLVRLLPDPEAVGLLALCSCMNPGARRDWMSLVILCCCRSKIARFGIATTLPKVKASLSEPSVLAALESTRSKRRSRQFTQKPN